METWKLIAAGVLILIGFNLLLYGHVKRRIRAAKAEGYKRQADEQSKGDNGQGSTD